MTGKVDLAAAPGNDGAVANRSATDEPPTASSATAAANSSTGVAAATNTDPTSTTNTKTTSVTPPSIRKHRSVKSLTREYEKIEAQPNNAGGGQSRPGGGGSAAMSPSPSSSSSLLTPDHVPRALPHSGSTDSLHVPTTAAAAVGLPPSSSAAAQHPRQRTSSTSSVSSTGTTGVHARSGSVLLASPSYPSTLTPSHSPDASPVARHERLRTLSAASATSHHSARAAAASAAASSSSPSSSSPSSGNNFAAAAAAARVGLGSGGGAGGGPGGGGALRLVSPGYPSTLAPAVRRSSSSPSSAASVSPRAERASLRPRMPRSAAASEEAARAPEATAASEGGAGAAPPSTTTNSGPPPPPIARDDASTDEEADDAVGELVGGASSAPLAPPSSSSSSGAAKALADMTPAERREHSRRHSRIHSRNLSVFFPRPGSEAEWEADRLRAEQTFAEQPAAAPVGVGAAARPEVKLETHYLDASPSDVASASASSVLSPLPDGRGDAGGSSGAGASPSPSPSSPAGSVRRTTSSRDKRGHHRKHSVNHALFDGSQQLGVLTLPPRSGDLGGGSGGGGGYLTASEASVTPVSSSSAFAPPLLSATKTATAGHAHAHTDDDSLDARVGGGGAKSASLAAVAYASGTASSTLGSLPAALRPLAAFGVAQFCLGAYVWVAGQNGDSLAMAGLGYLVVFDAFGVLSDVGGRWWAEERARISSGSGGDKGQRPRGLRRPYGTLRFETLLHFTQSIYLVFASIYVLKESVEHALLEGTDEVHDQDSVGLRLPVVPLLLASATTLFSALVLRNHAKLVAACGISTAASNAQLGAGFGGGAGGSASASHYAAARRRGHGRAASVLVDPTTLAGPLLSLFSNPFGVTVVFFTHSLALASALMPAFQVAALDKVLAALESAAMLYVAWPASRALGKVLLQTAPPQHTMQSVQLMRVLKTIEEHPNVTYVAPPNLWQLTPPTSAMPSRGGGAPGTTPLMGGGGLGLGLSALGGLGGARPGGGGGGGGGASTSTGPAKAAALVASVRVFARRDCTDAEVLDLTRWAWQLAAPAVGAGAGVEAGESLRGSMRAGELVVSVEREEDVANTPAAAAGM